jgi:hypothetical protein
LKKVILALMLVVFSVSLTSCGGGFSSGTGGDSYPEADYTYVEKDAESIAPENLFYIAKNGNDSNPGTEALPWLTLQKAADTLTAGQKVYVKEGVYNMKTNHGALLSGVGEYPDRIINLKISISTIIRFIIINTPPVTGVTEFTSMRLRARGL